LSDLFAMGGQVALVTGAAAGLGREIAQSYAQQGAAVVLTDKNGPACAAAAAELRDRGHDVTSLAADLGDSTEVAMLATAALGWRGRIDTLVCNAGIVGPAGSTLGVDDPAWQAVFDVNLRSAVQLTCALIPSMALRRTGSVILISSIAGLRGNKTIGVYGLSKAALAQLARNLAVEWGPEGVRANAISPGLIRTSFSEQLMGNAQFMQRRLQLTPLRRVGEAHEIAGVAVLLATRAGGFITGQNIIVDGGTLVSDGS
jgi:NAD(P)-dependent dehydrogenase (short-subunit alcohol dehydrogenase family)